MSEAKTPVQSYAAPGGRPEVASRVNFFDFCPWRFRAWATEHERVRQREHQADLIGTSDSHIGEECFISPLAGVYPRTLRLGDRSYIAAYAYVTDDVTTGADCTINPYAVVRGQVRMGSGVRIGAHASIIGFNHAFSDPHVPVFQQGETVQGIELGDDVWVGSGVTILDGVTVGSHSILAAGAVITKDVPDHAIVGGNPARVLRDRLAAPKAGTAPDALEERLAAFGETVRQEWRDVLRACEGENDLGPAYLQQPGHAPTVRAYCDAVEIAAMFGEVPSLLERDALIELLQGFQDPASGLIPDRWSPPGPGDDPALLTDHLSRYHLLAVGYALELLGSGLRHPVRVIEDLDVPTLYGVLERLPWSVRAWSAGDWIDCYGTGLYLNARHFASRQGPESLLGWLHTRVDRLHGVWGQPGRDSGWLQPVNGYYRLTRGTYAQFGIPVPHPEATIDTVLRHVRDRQFFGEGRGNACNVLDVIHPLWLCGLHSEHRRDEVRRWAREQLERVLPLWVHGRGFSFDLVLGRASSARPSLQGTEMWLSIVFLLAEVLGHADALGYHPQGVHRLEPAWRLPELSSQQTTVDMHSPGA